MMLQTKLNEKGLNLTKLKWEINAGNIAESIMDVVIAPYKKEIQDWLKDTSMTCLDFNSKIAEIEEYRLTEKEAQAKMKDALINCYDSLLMSKGYDKFTLKLDKSFIRLEKYYRLNNDFYLRYMGTDLNALKQEALKAEKERAQYKYSYTYKNTYKALNLSEAKIKYDKELEFFNKFIESRCKVIANFLSTELSIPLLFNKINRKKSVNLYYTIENNMAIFSVEINLLKRKSTNSNIKLLGNVLSKFEEVIPTHLGLNLYT